MSQVERDTAQSMQRLVELDRIKTRMVESQNALQVLVYNIHDSAYSKKSTHSQVGPAR